MNKVILTVVAVVIGIGAYAYHNRVRDVAAFYYPDRNNLNNAIEMYGVGSVEGCRRAIMSEARAHNDYSTSDPARPITLARGDYECGVNFIEYVGSLKVYEQTVR